VGRRAVLDAVVKRKIPSPHQESYPRTPIVQPALPKYLNEFMISEFNSEYGQPGGLIREAYGVVFDSIGGH
jgi:hypothetical protein